MAPIFLVSAMLSRRPLMRCEKCRVKIEITDQADCYVTDLRSSVGLVVCIQFL